MKQERLPRKTSTTFKGVKAIANKIKGLTLEIGGETTGLNKALSDVNKVSRDLKSELKDVERLLKLDPGNTELIAQKQKILADSVENTKEKLDTLKEAERQAQEQFKQGKIGEDQYRAIQREVIKTEEELKKMNSQLKEMDWKGIADNLDKFGKKSTELGTGLTKNVTAPIVAAGTGLVAIGAKFDDVFDSIRIGSGATGDALEGLKDDFRAVAKEVPASLSDVGVAIADYNTRLDLNGEALQDLSIQTLELVRITGGDLSKTIEETSQSFKAFNVPAEDYGKSLDFIFKVSQSTGISMDRMQSNMVKFAPALKQLDLSFEQSATLMGQLDKAGVDVEQTLAGLTKSVAKMAKEGITDANEAIEILFNKIKDAPTDIEGTQEALDVFGAKAGPALASAIREGKLEYADLLKELQDSEETILGVSDETKDWTERLVELKNKIMLAIEPIAGKLFDAINDIIPMIQKAVEWVANLIEKFANMTPETQKVIFILLGLAAAIGPILILAGKMSSGLSALINLFAPMTAGLITATGATGGLSAAIAFITGPIGIAIAAIVAITAVIIILWQTNEDFRDKMIEVWENIKGIIDGVITIIKGIIETFIGLITGDFTRFSNGLKTIWEGLWNTIKNIVAGGWNLLSGVFGTLYTNIKKWFTDLISNATSWGKNMISGFIDGIKSMASKVTSAVSGVVGKVSDFMGFGSPTKEGEGRYIVDWGQNMISGFIDGINNAVPELEKVMESVIPSMNATSTVINKNVGSVDHSGVIKVEGVSDRGELIGVVDMVMDELRREVRS